MGETALLAADAAAVLARWNAAGAAAVTESADALAATEAAGRLALRRIGAHADAVRTGSDVTALRAERLSLVGRRDAGRAEAVAGLRGHVQLARVELLGEVGARVRALHNSLRADVDRVDAAGLRAFPAGVTAAVQELASDVDALAVNRFERISVATVGLPMRTPPQPPQLDLGGGPDQRARTIEDRMMILLGASAGVGLGRLAVSPLSLVPALDIATIPVTLLLGGLASWWLTRSRGRVADRAHVRQWVADVLVTVKAQLEQWVAAAIVATESESTERIVRATARRTAEVDAEITRLDTELRQAGSRNAGQLAACERDRETLARGLAALTPQGTDSGSGASKVVKASNDSEATSPRDVPGVKP